MFRFSFSFVVLVCFVVGSLLDDDDNDISRRNLQSGGGKGGSSSSSSSYSGSNSYSSSNSSGSGSGSNSGIIVVIFVVVILFLLCCAAMCNSLSNNNNNGNGTQNSNSNQKNFGRWCDMTDMEWLEKDSNDINKDYDTNYGRVFVNGIYNGYYYQYGESHNLPSVKIEFANLNKEKKKDVINLLVDDTKPTESSRKEGESMNETETEMVEIKFDDSTRNDVNINDNNEKYEIESVYCKNATYGSGFPFILKDDIGKYTMKGFYCKNNEKMILNKKYIEGTGNSAHNLGHTVRIRLKWNKQCQRFDGEFYVKTRKYEGSDKWGIELIQQKE